MMREGQALRGARGTGSAGAWRAGELDEGALLCAGWFCWGCD